jgi:hypothetical protein
VDGRRAARAGVDPYLQSTYFPDVGNPVILEVRRERGIELVLEGLRFADLIRWKHGELLSSDRMYLYPIADADLTVNPKLGQNPGW